MATHSSILAWKSPWTEEPGGLKSIGLHDWACVHKCGGRWVGSNKVVELKKKKRKKIICMFWTIFHFCLLNIPNSLKTFSNSFLELLNFYNFWNYQLIFKIHVW